jgi:RNA recognition motif-containing protein
MSTTLYVGNLPYQTTTAELETLFQQAGTVESVKIITDQYTGQPRGFGFVEMASREEAENAISMLNNQTLHDRTLTVSEARPKRDSRNSGYGNRNPRGDRGGRDWNRGSRNKRW